LSCGDIFNRRQIPDRAPVIDAAQVATPHLVSVGDRQIVQQIMVGMMGCGDGTVALDPSPGWAQAV
jgi:hypothetical protein